MARLGGARVGMGPPVFGAKPPVAKKPSLDVKEESPKAVETPKEEEVKIVEEPTEHITEEVASPDAPTEPTTVRKNSESASLLSVDSENQVRSPPSTMPVPAVPRRTAPPRRKAKSPAPPTTAEEEVNEESVAATEVPPPTAESKETGIEDAEAPVKSEELEVVVPEAAPAVEAAPISLEEPKDEVEEEVASPEPTKHKSEVQDKESTEVIAASTEPVKEAELVAAVEQTVAEVAEETEEEGDEVRRKRVAEKLAKMGGINPFAAPRPPQRKPSTSSEDSPPTSPPAVKRDSVGSIEIPKRKGSQHVADVPEEVDAEEEGEEEVDDTHGKSKADISEGPAEETVEEAPPVAELTEEEEEEARRKRVAEKLAKMGGINPFSMPPQRKPSSSSEDVVSPTARSPPVKRGSVDYLSAPHYTEPTRKPSAESSTLIEEPKAEVATVTNDRTHSSEVKDTKENEDSAQDESRSSSFVKQTVELDRYDSDEDVDEQENDEDPLIVSERDETTLNVSKPAVKEAPSHERHDESLKLSYDEVEEEEDVDTPPVPAVLSEKSSTYSPVPVDPATASSPIRSPTYAVARDEELDRVPSPAGRPVPPPRRFVPPPPDDGYDDEDDSDDGASDQMAASTLFIPPPREHGRTLQHDEYASAQGGDVDTDNESVAIPIPHRRPTGDLSHSQTLSAADSDAEYQHHTASRPRRSIPQPPSASISDAETDSDYGGEALPTRPRRSLAGTPDIPLIVRPPASNAPPTIDERTPVIRPHHAHSIPSPPQQEPLGHSPPIVSLSESDQEILDEEEGDPIDPSFHSPSRQTSTINLRASASTQASSQPSSQPTSSPPSASPAQPDNGEDEESSRRRTIAERMAKLGGIKFGAAPIPASISRRVPSNIQDEESESKEQQDQRPDSEQQQEQPTEELTEEEEERARKARIAAKLAGMGGMRIGMMPGAMPPPRSHAFRDQPTPSSPAPAPPQRAVPPTRAPPPPQPSAHEEDSEPESAASEDGVKVEAEESEIEELSYEEVAAAEADEEEAPPVPSRGPHRQDSSSTHTRESTETRTPSIHSGRPPVPTGLPMRKPSIGAPTPKSPTRGESGDSGFGSRQRSVHKPHSEYVMVDEPRSLEETVEQAEEVPLPPARPTSRVPPSRGAPAPPTPAAEDSISSQWELPSIPSSSLEFGSGGDLSLSWSEAGESENEQTSSPPPPPPPQKQISAPPQAEVPLSADDLIAVWGRVGVQICEVATTLFEKSKKTLVGDGTYGGFVDAVFREVPNASLPSPTSTYGYLVYHQSSNSVLKRASEIMPGDIVVLQEAKLKGHKGLQTYSQSVGMGGESVLGVVSEFEPKKSKVRVFQANQHVGQQTVEAISYRLEDLKSGNVKVYRVLEA
ncbi:hypothetical protein BDQ12DRAFT_338071 [Crucibulum laeve]|uniref:BBC1/AIM3 cysteine proteinase-fold domain-containing protein n=1 Tax=Crucibulum laeve TaxID=68775 RepID=A0A5C3LR18_9AGAR|nr:hypothetical protein BDQ12DRAFT_338071 [Crucibulum laeve]